ALDVYSSSPWRATSSGSSSTLSPTSGARSGFFAGRQFSSISIRGISQSGPSGAFGATSPWMGRSASILPAVDHTAPAILELGLLLLLAALAGKAARSIGLPAVIGYLLVGVLVSPFTPGYVANRDQLSILADVGVVLLLFEVGSEISPLRLAREGRRLLLLAPLQVAVTWILGGAACVALGMSIAGAAMIGLSIAMSSSVVVVNITRSRRRTTDRITDDELLGWSVIQDLVGVSA